MYSYGYIIVIMVDSCMIWFHFDCTMQLKKSYHIATNVCSRKSDTTFGDLPDWLFTMGKFLSTLVLHVINEVYAWFESNKMTWCHNSMIPYDILWCILFQSEYAILCYYLLQNGILWYNMLCFAMIWYDMIINKSLHDTTQHNMK